MKRLLPLAACVAALVFPISVCALNFHNGYIRVYNDSDREISVTVQHMVGNVVFAQIGPAITIPPHGTGYFNACCFAAGSRYSIRASKWNDYSGEVTLRLCNHQGIPFGYGDVKAAVVHWNAPEIPPGIAIFPRDEACPSP